MFNQLIPLLTSLVIVTGCGVYYQLFHKQKKILNNFIFELFINPLIEKEIKDWLNQNKNLNKLLDLKITGLRDKYLIKTNKHHYVLTCKADRETYSEAVSTASLLVAMITLDLSSKTIHLPVLAHRVIGTKINTLSETQCKQYYEAKILINQELKYEEIEQIKSYYPKIILENDLVSNYIIMVIRVHDSDHETALKNIKATIKKLGFEYYIKYIGYCRYDTGI